MHFVTGRFGTIAALGSAQTLAWASSYYLPAMLATPIASDLALAPPLVFAAFSLSLVVSALVGPWTGRAIDRWGGRPVLIGTNPLFALGLVALGLAQGPMSLFAAWALIGLAMGSGLYDAAFATLVKLYGQEARNPITGITLIAGFASTVLPVASAAATCPMKIASGKFHGLMQTQGPRATRRNSFDSPVGPGIAIGAMMRLASLA